MVRLAVKIQLINFKVDITNIVNKIKNFKKSKKRKR